MKKQWLLVPLLVLAATGLFAQNLSLEQAVQSSAKTIEARLPQGSKAAVLVFTADSQKFSDYIIDELAIAISENNKIRVVERQYTDVIRKELNIQMSGDVSDDEVKRVGIQLGAQYVVTGSLVDIGNAYRFRVSAINVETAIREASVALSINPSDPQVTFLLTGKRSAIVQPPAPVPVVQPAAPPPVRPAPANMARVEGGTFQMGSANGGSDEKPVHNVTVRSFYMGIYPVTQKEWREIMGTNPSNFKGDNLPVENVSWYDAVEYCNKLSQREGLTPCYRGSGGNITCDWNANGYRLPTEAEWEFAAKGGVKDLLTTEYSGSNTADAVAWYDGNSGSGTHPVGQKRANSLGIYDMSGNVWEWRWDWYGSYSGGSQADPVGASSGTVRVIRGGSWGDSAAFVRSAYRLINTPAYRYNFLGFRLVRS